MKHVTPILKKASVLAIFLLVASLAAAQAAAPASFASFTASDLDGKSVDQSLFADYDLTMINIWATFCSPCLREMPDLAKLSREYAKKKVQIVGIVMDTLDEKAMIDPRQVALAKDIVAKTGASYTHLIPSTSLILAKLQYVSAVPETIFVDKAGNIVGQSYIGSRDKKAWQKIIDATLPLVRTR